jgi:hypothetical protein
MLARFNLWWLKLKLAEARNLISSRPGMELPVPHMGGHGHEGFVALRHQSGCRQHLDCAAPVRPERHGDVANRKPLGQRRQRASRHRGRCTEASSQTTQIGALRRRPQHRIPSRIGSRSNAIGDAGLGIGEACQACSRHWQLRRRLPVKFQVSERTLARMLAFQRLVVAVLQKRRQLQNLQRVL